MIGQKIKQLRKGRKLSQQEMADLLGCGRSTLSEIEAEKIMPGGEILMSVKRHFPDVDMNWLLSNEDIELRMLSAEVAAQHDQGKVQINYQQLLQLYESTQAHLDLLLKTLVTDSAPLEGEPQRSGRINRTLEGRVENLEHNLETLQRFVQRIVFREGGAALLEEPPEAEPEGSNVHSVVYIKGTKEKTDKPQEEPENERA